MAPASQTNDLTRSALALLFIGILIAASFWILHPFITALIWATMIVVSTWPLMLSVQTRLWGKRYLAVSVMTLLLLMVLVVPCFVSIVMIVERSEVIVGWVRSLSSFSLPLLPDWIGNLPVVGRKLAERWNQAAAISPAELSARLTPYAGDAVKWFAGKAGDFGLIIVQFLLTVIIAAILYASGENAAAGIRLFARRLAGQQGEDAAILAAKAARGVALGVVVTALVQSVLGAAGLFLSGVPAVGLLTAVMFMLCLAQIGPGLVLIPSVAWLFWQDQTMWGSIMVVWTIIVGTIDNFIRPLLIKKGADLPLILIFAGVIGGLFAFGIVGLFIGPVVLAVTYTLLENWVNKGTSDQEPATDETS